jgi:hypothetical protein
VVRKMSTEPQRTCPSCGNEFSGAMEFCPVCLLRKGLGGGVASGESSTENTLKPVPNQPAQRFEHYELVTGENGKPVELGRGAMGVTYKAFDIDLQCPVTLKIISERYLCYGSARVRFLREARAAARLRHSNVASVLHLGRTESRYFYAIEFVEGETLEKLINRSRRVKVKLALEIAKQAHCSVRIVDVPARFALRIGQGTLGTVLKFREKAVIQWDNTKTLPGGRRGDRFQKSTDGRYAPAGSLYSPKVISVMGWTTRRPFSRHQRKRSELRVGTMIPGPAKLSAEAINAWRSRLVSATACPKKASTVAYPVIRSGRSTTTAVPPFMASASSAPRSCP